MARQAGSKKKGKKVKCGNEPCFNMFIKKKAAVEKKKPAVEANRGKSKKAGRMRNAFTFNTDEAKTMVIEFKGKRAMFRLPMKEFSSKRAARNKFILYKIFHELFPQNSIKPLGIKAVNEKEFPQWGLVSEILKNRSPEYKIYQQAFYRPRSKMKLPEKAIDAAIKKHERFVNETAMPALIKIALETGIRLNNHPVNICNVKGNPVFFEIAQRVNHRLLEYINKKVKNPKKREMLTRLAKKL